jgi:hypothetical protein
VPESAPGGTYESVYRSPTGSRHTSSRSTPRHRPLASGSREQLSWSISTSSISQGPGRRDGRDAQSPVDNVGVPPICRVAKAKLGREDL